MNKLKSHYLTFKQELQDKNYKEAYDSIGSIMVESYSGFDKINDIARLIMFSFDNHLDAESRNKLTKKIDEIRKEFGWQEAESAILKDTIERFGYSYETNSILRDWISELETLIYSYTDDE